MKSFLSVLLTILTFFCYNPILKTKASAKNDVQPEMAIVIDDFGSYDQSGVETMLSIPYPITVAVMPNVDNSQNNYDEAIKKGYECILHMPMQSHVSLPESWYGPVYIKNYDSKETIFQKIDSCIKNFPEVKGFNMHIGSGVSRNKEVMKNVYEYANNNNLYFLDSRTIETNGTTDACKETNSTYLGRDVFLEAEKNRSYSGVCKRLFECAGVAKQKNYSIAIGHVGAEGGENTAQAIKNCCKQIENMGIKIVSLSKIYEKLK